MSRFGQCAHELTFEWVHLQYEEKSPFVETYGFSGNQGAVNLEGMLIRPRGVQSKTLLIYMHPASTLQLLPVPRESARAGMHVLCAGSRYARNDTAAILEKILLDLGEYVRHARVTWGYERIVLCGWSGGGSLSLFYQSEAEKPTITHTPAGDPVDVRGADLMPADAVLFHAAHISRAQLLLEAIDPSVRTELDPDWRVTSLDIYDKRNPNRPPYTSDFMARYRLAQRERMRRITATVKATLLELAKRGTGEMERGFVVHRTFADPRFLDGALDPNDRRVGWCYLGNPETANTGPVGLARFCTLRSWLSQWSVDDSRADGVACARRVSVPLLVIENTADDAVPPTHPRRVFDAAASVDKTFESIAGATHYYAGQPSHLRSVTDLTQRWLADRGLRNV